MAFRMKLAANGLHLENFDELEALFCGLGLSGILRLNEDLKDHQEKVLIKQDIAVRQSQVDKLREIRGAFHEDVTVKLTSELVEAMAAHLIVAIEQLVRDNPLFCRLYEEWGKKAFRYMLHALKHRRIAAALYIIQQQSPDHFGHVCNMGILALGIAMKAPSHLAHLHTKAFLTGLLAELPFKDRKRMIATYDDPQALQEASEKAAMLASRLKAPVVVTKSIRSTQAFSELAGELEKLEVEGTEGRQVDSMENVLFFDQPAVKEEGAHPDDEQLQPLLAEILKVARYVIFLFSRLEQSDHLIEEVSFRVAYNARKGFFNFNIVQPVLNVFREYELEYRALMMIADVEGRCPYKNSAWAYPKPRATQVVCRHRVTDCPHIQKGWDLHIVSPQESFGWIGASLEAGRYQKCDLEEGLQKIRLE